MLNFSATQQASTHAKQRRWNQPQPSAEIMEWSDSENEEFDLKHKTISK